MNISPDSAQDTTDTGDMEDFGGYLARPNSEKIVDAWRRLAPAVLEGLRQPPDEGVLAALEAARATGALESMPAEEQARLLTAATVGLRLRMPDPVRDLADREGKTVRLPGGDTFPEASSLLVRADPAAAWVALRTAFGPESVANPGIPPARDVWRATPDSSAHDARTTMARTLQEHSSEWRLAFRRISDWANFPRLDVAYSGLGKEYDWAPGCSFSPRMTEEEARASHERRVASGDERARRRADEVCMVNITGPHMDRRGEITASGYSRLMGDVCEEKATRFFKLGRTTWCLCQAHAERSPAFTMADGREERWLDQHPYEVPHEEYVAAGPDCWD